MLHLPPGRHMFVPTPTWLLWEAFTHVVFKPRKQLADISTTLYTHSGTFIHINEMGRCEDNEHAQTWKKQHRGFETGLLNAALYD